MVVTSSLGVPRKKAFARPFETDPREPGPRSFSQHVLEGDLQAAHAQPDLLCEIDDGDWFVRARADDLDRAADAQRVDRGFAEAVGSFEVSASQSAIRSRRSALIDRAVRSDVSLAALRSRSGDEG